MAARTYSTGTLTLATSWGPLRVSWRGDDVVAIDPPVPGAAPPTAERNLDRAPAAIADFASRFARYLDGEAVELATEDELARWLDACDIAGFRRDVSLAMARVPRGMVVSYGQLAELAGRPGAARAVGTICGKNPLAVVVPCHRVVPASGGIGSYGFHGPAYKQRLLDLEGWSGRGANGRPIARPRV